MAAEPLLALEEVAVRLGGESILAGISLSIASGGLTALVGPNGAGKTTLFNAISGEVRLAAGRIRFLGREIGGLPPERRARLGIGRAFQLTELFPTLSVFENVRLAVQGSRGEAWHPFRPARSFGATIRRTVEVLEATGLAPYAARPASALGHGDQRRLDLAIALASAPRLLLLDEPTAGMSAGDIPPLLDLIARLKRDGALTLLLVEHKMDVIHALADRLIVLDRGRIIADGPPAAVMGEPAVREAYLGFPADG